MKFSIVIPVYNGQNSIAALVSEIKAQFPNNELEIILVNDCSKDSSESICEQLAVQYDFVNFISLRKNAGEHNAVLCGLHFVTGEYAAIVDDDFQNPPSEINKLFEVAINDNFDVVYSKYKDKKHHWARNLGSKLNDQMANILLNKPRNLYLSSFKVINKGVVDEIIKYTGPFPYIDGLILRVTNNIGTKLVEHKQRDEGRSNYTLFKLISLYLNMFLNFSVIPLRVFTISGMIIFIIGILLSVSIIIEKLVYQGTPPGWAFTIIVILTVSGFQTMFLGLIAEYLGKLFLAHNGTPQFVIKKQILNNARKG